MVQKAVAAINLRDWGDLKLLLHPYLHWTNSHGQTVRGRTNVLAKLVADTPTGPPTSYELRDGQIYRWVEKRMSG